MSTSSLLAPPAAADDRARTARPRAAADLRLLRSELRLVFGRRRHLALLVALAAVPLLMGIVLAIASDGPPAGEGPQFLDRVTGNGVFLALAGLVVVLPFFLPLAMSVVAGDAVAGEAGLGTLRYLLVVPAGRGRLLAVKYAALVVFALAAAALVALTGVLTGLLLFPGGEVTLLSGATVSLPAGLYRVALVTAYVGVSMAGLAAVGLFLSTLTEMAVGAMAATIGVAIVSQILDAIPQVSWLHPYLLTHHWLAFGDLLRDPIVTGGVRTGVLVQLAYVLVFGALAWARFTTDDVSG